MALQDALVALAQAAADIATDAAGDRLTDSTYTLDGASLPVVPAVNPPHKTERLAIRDARRLLEFAPVLDTFAAALLAAPDPLTAADLEEAFGRVFDGLVAFSSTKADDLLIESVYTTDVDGFPVTAPGPLPAKPEQVRIGDARRWRQLFPLFQAASLLVDPDGPSPRPTVLIADIVETTDGATVTAVVAGGPTTTIDLVEISPGSDHSQIGLPGTQRVFPISGLPSNTVCRFGLTVSGPGGESTADFTFTTLPIVTPPVSISLRNSFPSVRADNGATLTIAKPTGAVTGDTVFIVASRDTGALSTFLGPAGFSEATFLAIGAANGVAAVRVWYRTLTAGDASVTSWAVGSDGNDSSTVVAAVAVTGSPVSIISSAKTANLGTSTSIVAPSINGVDGGILVTAHFAVPSPNPSTGRSFTPPSGMTERVDLGTVQGYWYAELSTLALTAGGATGTKTAVASGALTASYAISFVVAAAGGDPSITPPTLTVGAHPSDATKSRISGTVTGNFDQIVGDVIGDGLPPSAPFVGAGSVAFQMDVARQPSAFDVNVALTPTLGTATGSAVTVGPYTISALPGGGTLPAQTTVVATADVVDGQTYRDEHRIAPNGWNLVLTHGAYSGTGTTERARAANAGAAHFYNCTADGNATVTPYPGGMGIYLNSGYLEDFTIINWGGAYFFPGNPNPNNGHAAYIRNVVAHRLHIMESAVRRGGENQPSYGLSNQYSGGGTHFIELFDFQSDTAASETIASGNGNLVDSFIDGFNKPNGTLIIGGLVAKQCTRLIIHDMHVNAIVIRSNWSDVLKFTNSSYRTKVLDGLTGTVLGIDEPGGLQQAA